jgi:hypothetical protein
MGERDRAWKAISEEIKDTGSSLFIVFLRLTNIAYSKFQHFINGHNNFSEGNERRI